MNYKKIYENLIEKARSMVFDGYYEKHHIKPRCIGGNDSIDNIIKLTARQHYIAHMLLYKIYENDELNSVKLLNAVICMRYGSIFGCRKIKYNSRLYSKMKENFSRHRSEQMISNNVMKGKMWVVNYYTCSNKIIDKGAEIPHGYILGRCTDFSKFFENLCNIGMTVEEFVNFSKNKFEHGKLNFDKVRTYKRNEKENEDKRKRLELMYNDYVSHGFDYVKEKYNYLKTRENLIQLFSRYVPNYDKNLLYKVTVGLKRKNGDYAQSEKNKKMPLKEKIDYFTNIYSFFKEHTFEETKNKFNWVSSRNALIQNFKKYVGEYIPTPTHRWG